MEFSRTSDTSIRCVLSKSEIAEAGVSLQDILQNKSESIEFLHRIVDLAAREVGYEDSKKLNTLQMAVVQDEVVLHISESGCNPDQFKKDVLEKVRQMGTSEKNNLLQEHVDAVTDELTDMMAEMSKQKQSKKTNKNTNKKTRKSMPLDQAEKKIREVPYIFQFEKLQELYSYIASINKTLKAQSKLFKRSSGEYILAISDMNGKADALQFGQAVLKASDYGIEVSQEQNYLVHLEETCECLIGEDAVEKLGQCI